MRKPTPNYQWNKTTKKKAKTQKSLGKNGIQGEILKRLDEETVSRIQVLLKGFGKRLSEEWTIAWVYLIHKKKDPKACNNYRRVALLSITNKILAYYLLDRIKLIAKGIIGDY